MVKELSLSLKEFVEEISALPLAFQPGEAWRYSVSIDVLGRILEVLEGKRLEDILKELIFLEILFELGIYVFDYELVY